MVSPVDSLILIMVMIILHLLKILRAVEFRVLWHSFCQLGKL